MIPANIVIAEDDHLQRQSLRTELSIAFPSANFVEISTEREFRQELSRLVGLDRAVFVIDVMMRWCDPSPDMGAIPEDVIHGGSFCAGVRCFAALKNLRSDARAVVYSVLDESDVPLNEILGGPESYVRKDSDFSALLQRIRMM